MGIIEHLMKVISRKTQGKRINSLRDPSSNLSNSQSVGVAPVEAVEAILGRLLQTNEASDHITVPLESFSFCMTAKYNFD